MAKKTSCLELTSGQASQLASVLEAISSVKATNEADEVWDDSPSVVEALSSVRVAEEADEQWDESPSVLEAISSVKVADEADEEWDVSGTNFSPGFTEQKESMGMACGGGSHSAINHGEF
jgi:hypothetical protein